MSAKVSEVKSPLTPLGSAPSEATQPHPPPQIPDHELLRLIGLGSYGEVWLARNVIGTYRAVKVVYRDRFENERPYEREYSGIQKFEPISRTHEGMVDILQIGRNDRDGYFYYVMELADAAENPKPECQNPKEARNSNDEALPAAHPFRASGFGFPSSFDIRRSEFYVPRTLKHELRTRGALPVAECVQIALSLTRALEHLHTHGLVHRDIKPSNIIFVNDAPKLADIGLVTDAGGAKSFVGTEGFIPPEGPGTPQADIYSLGKVLYEIATGKDRHSFPEPPTFLADFADRDRFLEFNEVIIRACETDTGRRYQSAQAMLADLALLQVGKSVKRLHLVERRLKIMTRIGIAACAVMVLGVVPYFVAIKEARLARAMAKKETEQRRRADQEAQRARILAYASDMNLAQQALRQDNLGRAQELLERNQPQPGQDDLRGWEWRYLWQQSRSDAMFMLCQTPNPINSLAVSHDGQWLAVRERGQSDVSVWNLQTRQQIARLPAGEGLGRGLVFSPREPLLAFSFVNGGGTMERESGVRLWAVESNKHVQDLLLEDCCSALAFSIDGRRLAAFPASSDNRPLGLWQVPDGTRLSVQTVNDTYVDYPVAMDGDLSIAFHSQKGGAIRAIDPTTGRECWTIRTPDDYVTALALSPDGKVLASGSGYVESVIRLWDVESGRERSHLEGHRGFISVLKFWPDGKTLASASGDQTIRLWDLSDPKQIPSPRVLRGHKREIWALALLPDKSTLVSGSNDGTILFWDTRQTRSQRTEITLPTTIATWQFAPNSMSLIGVDRQGRLVRWHGSNFQEPELLLEIGANSVAPLVSADGRWLASGTTSGVIQVWDLARRTVKGQFTASAGRVAPVQFLAQGNRLVVTDDSDTFPEQSSFQEWDLQQWRKIRSWSGAGDVTGSAFSPDEHWHLGLSYGGSSTLFNLVTDREADHAPGCGGAANVTFSPDGQLFAAASYFGFVQLCDAATRSEIATLRGFLQGCVSVAFSPDGQRIAAGGDGKEAIKLWDMRSLQEVLTLEASGSSYARTAFSPDGSILGSSTRLGTLHIWRAPSWEEIKAGKGTEEIETAKDQNR